MDQYLSPILYETNRRLSGSGFISLFSTFFIIVQIIISCYYLLLPDSEISSFLDVFIQFFYLGYSPKSFSNYLRLIVICSNTFTFITTMIFVIHYQMHRKIQTWWLYILRFWHGSLFNITIIPNFVLFFSSFSYYGKTNESLTILWIVLHFVGILIVFSNIEYTSIILKMNPFLSPSFFNVWRPKVIFVVLFSLSIPSMLMPLTDIFHNWAKFWPHIAYLFVCFPIVNSLNQKPFFSLFLNSFAVSLPVFITTCTIIAILKEYLNIPSLLYVFIPLSIFIISHIIYFFIIKKKQNYIIQFLSNDDSFLEKRKDQYFSDENISYNDSFFFLQTGIQNGCYLVLTFCYNDYLLLKYRSNSDLMILLAWISAIFPSTTGELNKYLAYSKKLCNLSFSNRAFLHQLQRIYFLRESDSSDESIEDLEMISLLTNETISYSTTFWSIAANNTDELNSSIFTGIAYATKTAQVKWSEILEKYPNNYIFAQEYSRYLIDAECKFNEGTNWLIKSNIMEKTQKSFVDNMFKSFLHTFPFYLKDGIVNTSGKLLPGTANIILEKLDIFEISDSLSDFYATSSDSSIESLTKGEANKILPKGEIRLTMEKALNTVGIPISTKLRFAAIFRLVFTFGYAIGITIWIIFSYGSNKILFKDILLLSNVIDDFERMSINLASLFFSSYSQKYEKENQDYLIYNDSNKALIDLSNFMDQLYSNNDKEDLILFNRIFSSSLVDTVECSILDTLKPVYKEMGSTPDFQLRGFIYETLILMVNSDVEKQHWLFDTNFCNSYHGNYGNQKTILNLFTYLSPSWKGIFNGGFKAMTSDIIKNRTSSLLSSSPVSLFGVYTTNNTKKIASQSDKSDSFSGLSLLELTLSEIFAKRTTNQEDTFDFQIMQEIDQSFAFNFFRSFSPIAIGCISLPALILMASAIIHVKESFCNYLIRVSNEEMKKASKFLIAKESKGPVPTARMNTHSYRNLSWIWNMIMAIIVIVLFIVQSFYGLVNYNDHLIITQHTIFSILQRSLIYELARDTLYSVFFYQLENEGFHTSEGHINNSPISSYDVNFKQVEYDLKIYETLELLMEEGYDDHLIPRINNYNDKIDEFKENEKCTLASKFYQCLSFNRLLSYFKNQIKEIHHSPQLFSIESDEILYLIDIVN
ncbi:hypothetical protein TRFO_23296 [Tritrichomonas foetus]|uniref:Uncharacterized protein n=1 Tax=Tritrichomonas foetus TaxID=1144522 RepID=A0A1J4KBF0_9EUKA|nr:hypothetical protein TRFO_23296 [Tritrichomonas foetus]|eukprot:OHT08224.1 hypothetical protein TRFO_23296 [Tritrichomonas foetus]